MRFSWISHSHAGCMCVFLVWLSTFMIMWNISIDGWSKKKKNTNRIIAFPTIVMKMGFDISSTIFFFLVLLLLYLTREIDIFHLGWRCIHQVHFCFVSLFYGLLACFVFSFFFCPMFNDFHWLSIASIVFLWCMFHFLVSHKS